jgi:hypothetical protein
MKFVPFKTKQMENLKHNQEQNTSTGSLGNVPSQTITVIPPVTADQMVKVSEVSAMTPTNAFDFLITDLKIDGEKYVDVIAHVEAAQRKYNNLQK